ncbi:MAG: hypothetical protein Q9209_004956 [Squamulea sp. 1 TL-2023]
MVNLIYWQDSNEPSFLKKLKGEFGSTDSARQQRPQARPRKQRNADDEDDDQPVYVHDKNPSESLSKAEYDALFKAPSTEQQLVEVAQHDTDIQASREMQAPCQADPEGQAQQELSAKERTAGIGGIPKKRSAKVVGDHDSSDEAPKTKTEPRAPKKQGLKKGKKMKLSFEED